MTRLERLKAKCARAQRRVDRIEAAIDAELARTRPWRWPTAENRVLLGLARTWSEAVIACFNRRPLDFLR